MRDSWSRAFLRAIPIALWLFALAVVSVAFANNWEWWRMNVAALKADLDPRPRVHEMSPDGHEDARARVTRAEERLRQTNRTYGGYFGICAAIGGALLAVPVVYRRRVPRERRPSWRSWIFVVPIVAGLVAMGLRLLGYAMRGAILG